MSLNKFMEPTTLFSQQSMGLAKDYPMAFLAAKCMIASMGSSFSRQNLNTPSRNSRSMMFPWWKRTRLVISSCENFELRMCLMRERTSSKQLERSSTMTTLAEVCSMMWTTVWLPMNPSPPGTSMFLIVLMKPILPVSTVCKRNRDGNMLQNWIILSHILVILMLQQDQMFRLLVTRYANKLVKPKKQASYMLQEKKQGNEQELPLEEAIAKKGDHKLMDDAYNPTAVQRHWNSWWEHNKFFHANNQTANPKRFTICLPPPNVTGYLHIGHALTVAIEDALVRNKRMSGYETLFLPGTDHAGIATQTVAEKKLFKETGKTRHDLGREKFLEVVWQFKETHGNGILNQLRRTAGSMDWDRLAFTMDDNLSKAVAEGFVRLFEMGLIYRANRLVNWSTTLKTAISDIEVQHIDIEKRTLLTVPGYEKKVEFGVIVHFKYALKDDPTRFVEVATTRIQTMLGDTAIAVHPEDPRYKDLVGKEIQHPFIKDRHMVVVADEMVDREFGTGCVKITPAHDHNDYACGQRHKLEFINIFTDEGLINENGGQFKGLKRFDCRRIIEQELKKLGLLVDKKDNKMRLGLCSRSNDVIEPIIKPQWYVKCSEISNKMIDIVKTGEMVIHPKEEQDTWYRWMENLKDWCISRQLWWGHRIPAYFFFRKGNRPEQTTSTDNWVAARSLEEAYQKAEKLLGLPRQEIDVQQDGDVLDTWFSSGLFPFSPLKWPDVEHPDYKAFFPNQILETGHDILFFWVARMVMMSVWLTGKIPFKEVLLHPLVCDSEGNKMSKSRGNVIDPLQIIEGTTLDNLIAKVRNSNLPKGEQDNSIKKLKHEFPQGIAECGSDALRFGLLSYMVQSRSINLNINKIVSYRQFCNKIWQTFKFTKPKFDLITDINRVLDPTKQNFVNSWILAKLNAMVIQINNSFERYALGEAANSFYNFWQYELCDVYLEATKPVFIAGSAEVKELTALTLFVCVETGLRSLHPMMPFISEELYQKLPAFTGKAKSITIAPFPTPLQDQFEGAADYFKNIDAEFEKVNKIAGALRSIASSVNLPPHIRPAAYVITDEAVIKEQTDLLATLGKCSKVHIISEEKEVPKGCGISNIGTSRIFLELGAHINFEKELERLNKRLTELTNFKANVLKSINDPNRHKKPEKVKLQEDQKLEGYLKEEAILSEAIQKIKDLQ